MGATADWLLGRNRRVVIFVCIWQDHRPHCLSWFSGSLGPEYNRNETIRYMGFQ